MIDDIGTDGQGIGHHEGIAVFVDGALPGETVRAKMIALKKIMESANWRKLQSPPLCA